MSSKLHELFGTNKQKECDGIEVTFGVDIDSPSFRIARAGRTNMKYKKALAQLAAPYQRQIALETLPDGKADEIKRSAFITGCLLGWNNVKDKDGKTISYSAEAANQLFIELPDLYDELERQAQNMANFRDEVLESAAKNS